MAFGTMSGHDMDRIIHDLSRLATLALIKVISLTWSYQIMSQGPDTSIVD